MSFKSVLIIIGCLLSLIWGHPPSTFNVIITDMNGNVPPPAIAVGERTTIYFRFEDILTNYESINFANLDMHHARWVHLLVVSFDWQLAAHLHPDDFKNLTVNNTQTVFSVDMTFPKGGKYSFSFSFIYHDIPRNLLREGVALVDVEVTGTPVMRPDLTTFNFTTQNSFRTYPVNSSDVFDDFVDVNTNLDDSASGYTAVFTVDGQVASNGGVPPNLGTNIKVIPGKCVSIYLDVFDSNGRPAKLVPYLVASAHFTVSNKDNAVYHAHAMYRPKNIAMQDVITSLNGLTMNSLHNLDMMTDPLYNLSMNALMIGILNNGTINCASDAGVVMKEMQGMMDMSFFYGPSNFSSVMGIFNFPDTGNFTVWAYVKVMLDDGTTRLIVPHFSVFSAYDVPPTTGDDVDGETTDAIMGGASTLFTSLFLTILLWIGAIF